MALAKTPVAARKAKLSETELDVLKVLWDIGAGTVREVNEVLARQGRRWAYTTVLTLLQRLQAKGFAASDASGLAHVFRPALSRDDLMSRQLSDLADELCDGAPAPLVLTLVERHRFSAEEIARLRRLLDDAEARPEPPRGRRRGR